MPLSTKYKLWAAGYFVMAGAGIGLTAFLIAKDVKEGREERRRIREESARNIEDIFAARDKVLEKIHRGDYLRVGGFSQLRSDFKFFQIANRLEKG